MPKPLSFGTYNDMSKLLTDEQKADGWKYALTKEEQWDKYGYVVADQIRFRLHAKEGKADVVEDYLDSEKKELVDINLPDSLGMTPLMWATRGGHIKVAAALLRANADLGIVDRSVEHQKITAYDYAKGYPHAEGCEMHNDCLWLLEEYMRSGGQVPASLPDV
eukprot:CAMPEP_0171214758 /NCGR_PEP_ID=MMETSP0790-20130122/31323_1 /TAXON_ID=2925 /ORGANISM="Alexandrium catenella, Strain OF101" /LENGTH=162 /DNA_ID=CAMNT_0011680503 /DNA_START=84 /DNA_END=572 /DNA_ORIENTATION=-